MTPSSHMLGWNRGTRVLMRISIVTYMSRYAANARPSISGGYGPLPSMPAASVRRQLALALSSSARVRARHAVRSARTRPAASQHRAAVGR